MSQFEKRKKRNFSVVDKYIFWFSVQLINYYTIYKIYHRWLCDILYFFFKIALWFKFTVFPHSRKLLPTIFDAMFVGKSLSPLTLFYYPSPGSSKLLLFLLGNLASDFPSRESSTMSNLRMAGINIFFFVR